MPQVHGPEPRKMWFAIGSKLATTSAGLTIIKLPEKGEQFRAQLTVDPEREYCEIEQPELEVQAIIALSHAGLPAFVQ
jgi:hypothetical protein